MSGRYGGVPPELLTSTIAEEPERLEDFPPPAYALAMGRGYPPWEEPGKKVLPGRGGGRRHYGGALAALPPEHHYGGALAALPPERSGCWEEPCRGRQGGFGDGPPTGALSDAEAVATARLRGLDAQARAEVREAAQKIIYYGLGCLNSDLLLAELNAAPASPGSFAPGGNVWRNVHYGDPDCRRLNVFADLGVQKDPLGSVPFGERLVVADEADLGPQTWVRLADGPFTGKWVLARSQGVQDTIVSCVRMSEWVRKRGAVPQSAFRGQGYPEAGMFTRGYAGSGDICLVSCSASSLWRALHVETLFRDIATATVREDHWARETHFDERIVHFATNCVQFGQLRTRRPKRLVVVVKHSPRWRLYQQGLCAGPKLSTVKEDVDPMQFKECQWLHGGAQGLELKWSSVEFVTALEFLRNHCHWTDADCRRAAGEKLASVLESFHTLSQEECRLGLEAAFWCWDEAFSGTQLEVREAAARESTCQLLRELSEVPEIARPSLELGKLKESSEHAKDGAGWAASLGEKVWGRLLEPARAAAASVGQQVYVVGGCSSACLSTADRLTPCKALWSTAPSAYTRRSHLAAAVLKGCLYVLGGRDGSGSFLASVERFDPERRAWSSAAPLSSARAGLAAASVGGLLYAVGGWNGRTQLATTECLDPAVPSSWRQLAPAPTERSGLAAAGCPEAGFFALGGEDAGHNPLAAAERFNPSVGAWTELPPMPTARSGLSAAVLGPGLFAVGGFDGERALGSVERFDIALGTWSTLPVLPTPRHGLACVALAGAVYALGGRDAKYAALAMVERYDPAERRWTPAAPMPAPRGYLAAGVLIDCLWQGASCNSCYAQ